LISSRGKTCRTLESIDWVGGDRYEVEETRNSGERIFLEGVVSDSPPSSSVGKEELEEEEEEGGERVREKRTEFFLPPRALLRDL